MSKERRAVSLDPEVDAYLGREGVNASGLVNDLVKRHMNGGDESDELRELRRKQIKSELEALERRTEHKKEELATLDDIESQKEEQRDEKLSDAIAKAKDAPRDPDNPAIKTQAQRVGMDPEEFLDELPEKDSGVDL